MLNIQRMDACAFVMTVDVKTGKQSGMAATWLTRCEHDPPMWSVAMHKNSHTLKLIKSSHEFVLALATPDMQEAFTLFGTTSGAEKGLDKILSASLQTARADTPGIRSLLLPDAHANFVCRLANITPCGNDYFMVVGQVIEEHSNPGTLPLYYTGKDTNGQRVYATQPAEAIMPTVKQGNAAARLVPASK